MSKCVVVYSYHAHQGNEIQFMRAEKSETYLPGDASKERLCRVLEKALNDGKARMSPAKYGGYFCYVHNEVIVK